MKPRRVDHKIDSLIRPPVKKFEKADWSRTDGLAPRPGSELTAKILAERLKPQYVE